MAGGHDLDAARARALFPRGLAQPDWFRFSVDALLLAAFAARWLNRQEPGQQDANLPPRRGLIGLDLGTGCGVAALALLLTQDDLHMVGVDLAPDMVACAEQNRQVMGLDQSFDIVMSDVSSYKHARAVDFALANPPYFQAGSGRQSPEPARQSARFESGSGLDGFLLAASRNVKHGGPLFMVHQAEGLDRVLSGMAANGLAPKRVLPVYGRADKPASLALVEARVGGGPGMRLEPGLVLYGQGQALTARALAFCPHLECNASRGGSDSACIA